MTKLPASMNRFRQMLYVQKYTNQFVDVMILPMATFAMPQPVECRFGLKGNAPTKHWRKPFAFRSQIRTTLQLVKAILFINH